MKPYILLIGAYERDNFGDLLFPKILDKVLSSYSIIKGGLISKDLTTIGGDCIVSAKEYLTNRMNNLPLAVIHCGGETMTCLKKDGIFMNLPPSLLKQINNSYSAYAREISDKLAVSNKTLAYLYSHADLIAKNNGKSFPIAFISLGGTSLYRFSKNRKFLSMVKSKLESAKFISVRDRKSQKYLKEYLGIKAELYPDLVSILSRTNAEDVSQATKQPRISKIIKDKPYILFQANHATIKKFGISIIANKLDSTARKLDKSLVLQPAGLIGGHDDLDQSRLIARLVSKREPGVNVIVQEDRNLWNQAAIIANSACSISTSLHVRIVASSFARPHISLTNEKVNSYVESWKIDAQPYKIIPSELPEAVERSIKTDYYRLKQISNHIADKVEDGLRKMITVLSLNHSSRYHKEKTHQLIPMNLFTTLSIETDRLRKSLVKEIYSKNELARELSLIKSSRSWRLTAPLRSVNSYVKNLFKIRSKKS